MANTSVQWLDLEYTPSEIRVWYCNTSKAWVVTKYDNHGYTFDESQYSHYKSEAVSLGKFWASLYSAKLVVENRTN